MKNEEMMEELLNEEADKVELMFVIDDSLGGDYISEEAEKFLAKSFGLTEYKAVWRFHTEPMSVNDLILREVRGLKAKICNCISA